MILELTINTTWAQCYNISWKYQCKTSSALSPFSPFHTKSHLTPTATMRLDYVPNPPTGLSSEDQEVLERVKVRRGEMGLIPLDLTLLHAPKIADGEYSAK